MNKKSGFVIEEVITSIAIFGISIVSFVSGTNFAYKNAASIQIQNQCLDINVQKLEQLRSARWSSELLVDNLVSSNFPSSEIDLGFGIIGTNYINIKQETADIKFVESLVIYKGKERLITNSLFSLIAVRP